MTNQERALERARKEFPHVREQVRQQLANRISYFRERRDNPDFNSYRFALDMVRFDLELSQP